MAAKMYYEADADPSIIRGRKVAIIGYGSQGHAHALNLKESGVDVVVGLREGSKSAAKAEAAGLKVMDIADAAEVGQRHHAHDARHRAEGRSTTSSSSPPCARARRSRSPTASTSASSAFARRRPSTSSWSPPRARATSCAAPTPRAAACRRSSPCTRTPPAAPRRWRCPTPTAIGGTRAGVIETTFAEETETDLFGEQAVLCGGVTSLVQAGFETLVEAGYQPEMAYFECLHEVKLIVDLMYEEGIAGMRYSISDTAEYGDLTRGPRVVNAKTKAEMKKILKEIQSGKFAKEWIAESEAGRPNAKP
jgi:ketol-acid reductoisomerase